MRLPLVYSCDERFDDMRGDARTRRCDRCDRDVHDLSALTEAEAEAVLARSTSPSGRACVRYAVGRDGAVRFVAAAALAISVSACSAQDGSFQTVTVGPLAPKASAQNADAGIDDTYYLLGEIDVSEPATKPHCDARNPPKK